MGRWWRPRRPRDPRRGVDAQPREVIRELRPDDWPHPETRLVAEHDGSVGGWAALSPASARHCYRGVGEVSVYVAEAARGDGLGRALLAALVERSEQAGYWTL